MADTLSIAAIMKRRGALEAGRPAGSRERLRRSARNQGMRFARGIGRERVEPI